MVDLQSYPTHRYQPAVRPASAGARLRTADVDVRGVSAHHDQLALNACNKLARLERLLKNEQRPGAKAAQLDARKTSLQAANENRAWQVAEHNRRVAQRLEEERRRIASEHASRSRRTSQQQAFTQKALAASGAEREGRQQEAEFARARMQQAVEERGARLEEEVRAKAQRADLMIQLKASGSRAANDLRDWRVAEHRQKEARAADARAQRLAEADADRRRLVCKRQDQQRHSTSEAWAAKEYAIAEANRVRNRLQRASDERILRKQEEDLRKVERKRSILDAQVHRLQQQSGYREGRLEQVKYFEALVDSMYAQADAVLHGPPH